MLKPGHQERCTAGPIHMYPEWGEEFRTGRSKAEGKGEMGMNVCSDDDTTDY